MERDRALELAQAYAHRARQELTGADARAEAEEVVRMLGALREELLSRPPRQAYVVMTRLPGPGIRALVDEAVERTADDGKNDMLQAIREAVGQACEFVEVETPDGAGIGPEVDVGWTPYPDRGDLWRLGPFLLP